MLKLLFKKIRANRWMVLCLLIGLILSTAIVSSIPMYSDGILQKIISGDLNQFQKDNNLYPGSYVINKELTYDEKKQAFNVYDNCTKGISDIVKGVNLPVLTNYSVMTAGNLNPYNQAQSSARCNSSVEAITDFEKHIKLTGGTMYSDKKTSDGAYEVIVSDAASDEMDLKLGETYPLFNEMTKDKKPFKVKVVGIYTVKDAKDPYWLQGDWTRPNSFIMNIDLFKNVFLKNESVELNYLQWYYAFDYTKIQAKNIPSFVSAMDSQKNTISKKYSATLILSIKDLLTNYISKAQKLRITLLVLQMPMLLTFIFYIFMVSNLIIENDKGEISVAKSRGSNRKQIYSIYLLEAVFYSIIALITGPPLGLFFSKMIGASNGFLQFVDRKALPVSIGTMEYLYSLIVILIFIATMMIPVISASHVTVVAYKQSKVKREKKPLWSKLYLDIILLGISVYGIYVYNQRSGSSASDAPIDPILYIVSTVFILSLGLVFLRVFPYIIKFIFFIGRKKWSPASYVSLINVSRSKSSNQFIMLFLILTVSVGLFDVKAARTINTSVENNLKYSIGADVVIKAHWTNNYSGSSADAVKAVVDPLTGKVSQYGEMRIWYEPPYSQYSTLKGTQMATKVYKETDGQVTVGQTLIPKVTLMGVIPSEFGKIAWFDSSLLPLHWYYYLNAMTRDPRAIFLSGNFAKSYGIKKGDLVDIQWPQGLPVEGVVYGFIDYWPSLKSTSSLSFFAVCNLNYLQAQQPMEPYEVWIKKSSGSNTTSVLYQDIQKKKLDIAEFTDASQEIIQAKNDPMLQGTNGTLTIAFIATMLITAVGFAIFWILSIKDKVLQFGILRAMGLSLKELIGMLGIEQILISGIAILAGVLIGNGTCSIFIPFLKNMGSIKSDLLPFRPIAFASDYINLVCILLAILIIVYIILIKFISKININQAIKLGED